MRKRAVGSTAGQGQIEFDLTAAAAEKAGENLGATPRVPETGPQTEIAPVPEEKGTPVPAARRQDRGGRKAKVQTQRTKRSEIAGPVGALHPGIQPTPNPAAGGLSAPSAIVTSPKGIPARQSRDQAAARLPRGERWKRRLHPAAW
jgi:hypothetical protein